MMRFPYVILFRIVGGDTIATRRSGFPEDR